MRSWKVTALATVLAATSAFAAPTEESAAAQANNKFGAKLFSGTETRSKKGNKFLSPTSVYLALAIAANGASGTTQEEMEQALALGRLGRAGMNAANAKLMKALSTRGEGSVLSIANALWISKDCGDVVPAFLDRVVKPYSSRVDRLDFSTKEASATINGWAAKETRDKIKDIVPERLPEGTRILITNAVYFKAEWETKFQAMNTRMADFDNGTAKVSVPTMAITGQFRHAKLKDGSQAIALPYKDKKTEMIVWLPKDRDLGTAEKLVADGELVTIGTALDQAKEARGALTLPKLRMEYEAALSKPLKAMGMVLAFSPKADFSDLSKESVAITDVLQKTFVAIDEEGTEAAAVTTIVFGTTNAPELAFDMVVDRPYVFAIRDRETGTLLFVGSVQEPEGGKMPPPPKR